MKRLLVACIMGVYLASLGGCQFFQKPKPAGTEEAAEEEGGEETHADTGLLDTAPKPPIQNYRPISVKMPDGLKLEGTLYIPGISPYKAHTTAEGEGEEADIEAELAEETGEEAHKAKSKPVKPAKVQYPLVILLHMLSDDRWAWKTYPRDLVNAGYAVLALDMRGHGDSVYQGKRLIVWRQFADSNWQKLPTDLLTVQKHIAGQPEFNMVNTHATAIIGSSLGANVGLNTAAKSGSNVKALVLLSPGIEYHGIKAVDALLNYEKPIYFIASKEDTYAFDSAQRLYKYALGKKKLQIFEDIGHGTDMLEAEPSLGKRIISWLQEVMPGTTGGVKGAPEAEETETPKTAKPETASPSEDKQSDPKETAPAKPAPKAEEPKKAETKPAVAKVTAPKATEKPATPLATKTDSPAETAKPTQPAPPKPKPAATKKPAPPTPPASTGKAPLPKPTDPVSKPVLPEPPPPPPPAAAPMPNGPVH